MDEKTYLKLCFWYSHILRESPPNISSSNIDRVLRINACVALNTKLRDTVLRTTRLHTELLKNRKKNYYVVKSVKFSFTDRSVCGTQRDAVRIKYPGDIS